jgi:peptidylprolyl isomerase
MSQNLKPNLSQLKELAIEDLHLGDGKEIVKGALVLAHYIGSLSNGTVFDSSHQRGKPFQFVFGVGRVIKGWDQGLIGMRVGGKRKLSIPSVLAYGERQMGELIKPHSDLYFEIELIEVLTRDD